MIRRATLPFLGLAALLGCDAGLEPDLETALSLSIVQSDLASSADAGTLRLEGPTNRTLQMQPGQTLTIDQLQPGSYTVSLEAFTASQLESFAQTNVTVTAGRDTRATLSLQSFVPQSVTVPTEVPAGQDVTVQISPVANATSYIVEWDDNPGFTSPSSTEVTGTTASISVPDAGNYLIRARARSRFGSTGIPSAPVSVVAFAPPVITSYDVTFLPVPNVCQPQFRGFLTDEVLAYTDGDGDVVIGNRTEPDGIESEFRFEGATVWTDFYAGKSWSFGPASGGSSGTLRDVGSTCWRMPTDVETFVDVRVRLRDSRGNWSDWRELRVWLPTSVEITTGNPVNVGGSFQFEAIARDVNGMPVPGDAINWSVYQGPVFATIDAGGFYTLVAGAQGVDRVFARAGAAFANAGVIGPSATVQNGWWAPCWSLTEMAGTAGAYKYHRMTVYQGKEYTITLAATTGQTATGDPDLYIRFNAQPTNTVADAASTDSSFDEAIVYTAPANGVLWIGVHAFTDYAAVTLNVVTTDGDCGFPAQETLTSAPQLTGAQTARGPVIDSAVLSREPAAAPFLAPARPRTAPARGNAMPESRRGVTPTAIRRE